MGNQTSDTQVSFTKSVSMNELDKMNDSLYPDVTYSPMHCLRQRTFSNNLPQKNGIQVMSPSLIRKAKMKRFREQRPHLEEKQIHLVLLTWDILKKHIDHLGSDVFIR